MNVFFLSFLVFINLSSTYAVIQLNSFCTQCISLSNEFLSEVNAGEKKKKITQFKQFIDDHFLNYCIHSDKNSLSVADYIQENLIALEEHHSEKWGMGKSIRTVYQMINFIGCPISVSAQDDKEKNSNIKKPLWQETGCGGAHKVTILAIFDRVMRLFNGKMLAIMNQNSEKLIEELMDKISNQDDKMKGEKKQKYVEIDTLIKSQKADQHQKYQLSNSLVLNSFYDLINPKDLIKVVNDYFQKKAEINQLQKSELTNLQQNTELLIKNLIGPLTNAVDTYKFLNPEKNNFRNKRLLSAARQIIVQHENQIFQKLHESTVSHVDDLNQFFPLSVNAYSVILSCQQRFNLWKK